MIETVVDVQDAVYEQSIGIGLDLEVLEERVCPEQV